MAVKLAFNWLTEDTMKRFEEKILSGLLDTTRVDVCFANMKWRRESQRDERSSKMNAKSEENIRFQNVFSKAKKSFREGKSASR